MIVKGESKKNKKCSLTNSQTGCKVMIEQGQYKESKQTTR